MLGIRLVFFYQLVIFFLGTVIYLNRTSVVLYELYTLTEAAAFIAFLFTHIINKAVRKAVFLIGILFIALSAVFIYFDYPVRMIDSVAIGIETIIILVFSFYFLYERTNDTETLYIYSTFQFWIVIGMILYLGGSLFIHVFASILSQEERISFWIVPNILSILKNIFFAIAILVNSKPPKKLPPSDFGFSSLN